MSSFWAKQDNWGGVSELFDNKGRQYLTFCRLKLTKTDI